MNFYFRNKQSFDTACFIQGFSAVNIHIEHGEIHPFCELRIARIRRTNSMILFQSI